MEGQTQQDFIGGAGVGMDGAGYGSQAAGGGGYSRGPRAGGALAPGQRYDTTKISGKCFLGGLNLDTAKEAVIEYCQQW